ncbi:MAG: hypothetical protein WC612_02670 [Bdellovibrionales bacterium]|jgi:hypothetical protein
MKTFGFLTDEQVRPIQEALAHPNNIYMALFDRQSLWDPITLDLVLESFPSGHIDSADLFLVLAECIANAVLHGQAEILGFSARRRSDILLFTFLQKPPMQKRISAVLSMAKGGQIRECSMEVPGGLGFPILLKLARKITISSDYRKLHLWIKADAG